VRELHLRVPAEDRDAVTAILDERGVEYATVAEDDEVHVFFPLPTAAVSPVLDDLAAADAPVESYTVMTKAEHVEARGFESLRERYSASVKTLAKRELHSKIREMQWPWQLYYVGTVLSVVAATAGLILDQPALLIGAMIIAPQASSALAAPAGVLLSDWELFVDSVKEQAVGLGVAIVVAGAFAWSLRLTGFVPPSLTIVRVELVSLRLAPTLLSTIGAVIAGVVGAFGYTTEQSTALIGVMIAAALIPAAAAVGLAVAWSAPLFGLGALLLLLVNVLSINIGAFLALVGMGYAPRWRAEGSALRTSIPDGRRLAVYATLLCILAATLATGYMTGTNIVFARQVNQGVEATLSAPAYANLTLSSVQADYGGRFAYGVRPNVTVAVGRPPGQSYPDLAARMERRIERRTNRDVRVAVEFATLQRSSRAAPSIGTRFRPPVPARGKPNAA